MTAEQGVPEAAPSTPPAGTPEPLYGGKAARRLPRTPGWAAGRQPGTRFYSGILAIWGGAI